MGVAPVLELLQFIWVFERQKYTIENGETDDNRHYSISVEGIFINYVFTHPQ